MLQNSRDRIENMKFSSVSHVYISWVENELHYQMVDCFHVCAHCSCSVNRYKIFFKHNNLKLFNWIDVLNFWTITHSQIQRSIFSISIKFEFPSPTQTTNQPLLLLCVHFIIFELCYCFGDIHRNKCFIEMDLKCCNLTINQN